MFNPTMLIAAVASISILFFIYSVSSDETLICTEENTFGQNKNNFMSI